MIPTSSIFETTVKGASRTFSAKLLLNGTELGFAWKSLTIHKGSLAAENGFTVGTVFSSYIEATVDNLTARIEGKELELKVGLVLPDESVEFITVGYYTVPLTNVKKTKYTTTFTAVGRISSKLATAMYEAPTVRSLAGIAQSITGSTGVMIVFDGIADTSLEISTDLTGRTCYEVLAILASVVGGYATELADGSVVIGRYKTEFTEEVDTSRMLSMPSFSETDYRVEGACIQVKEEGENEDGSKIPAVEFRYGVPTLNISNPYMTESLFNGVFVPDVVGYQFRPGMVPLSLGDPRIEPNDVLEVTDLDGSEYVVPCHSITHTFDGGWVTEVEAAKLSDADNETAGPRPITEQLQRINSALVTAQEAIVKRATVSELTAERARIDLLDATKAYVDTLVAGGITADTLSAANAYVAALLSDNVTTANLSADKAYIEALTAAGITAQSLTTANAYIADLIAAAVTAQQIVADHATIGSFATDYAEIDFANVNTATISDAWIKALMVQGHIIAQSGAIYYLDAIHINANSIDAGTLKADRILLAGDDGLYYQINLDKLGQATIEAMTEAEIAELKHTIHADAITAHSITADHITVNNLVGTGGWINLAQGTFEYRNVSAANWEDASNGLKWDGQTLEIRADEILFTSGVNAEDGIASAQDTTAELANTVQEGNDSLSADIQDILSTIGALSGTVGTAEETVVDLSNKQDAETDMVEALQAALLTLEVLVSDEKTAREARMRFGTDAGGNPLLTLGGGENPELSVNLTNSQLQFIDTGTVVAYITGKLMSIANARVTEKLQFGNFAFIPQSDGGLALKYIG